MTFSLERFKVEHDVAWWDRFLVGRSVPQLLRAVALLRDLLAREALAPTTPEAQRGEEGNALMRSFDPDSMRVVGFANVAWSLALHGVLRLEDVDAVAARAGELAAAQELIGGPAPGSPALGPEERRAAVAAYVRQGVEAALAGCFDEWDRAAHPRAARR